MPSCYDTLFAAPVATFSLRLTGFVLMLVLLPGAIIQSIGTVVAALHCVNVCYGCWATPQHHYDLQPGDTHSSYIGGGHLVLFIPMWSQHITQTAGETPS